MATEAPPPAPPALDWDRDWDREELRIGLVLNGGVSLAVWMGGVTTEIDRLHRGEGAYGELLNGLETDARVDVISGASAGGLNGGLLATAIAHGNPMMGLDRLWVDRGAMERLLRSPFQPDPPSLMDGDGYFSKELERAFEQVAGGSSPEAGGDHVHLTMVTSVLNGTSQGLADDFGAVIPDVSHLGTFTFVRDDIDNAWTKDGALRRLALAARSSASFPFAFEPSFCPVNDPDDKERPNMFGYVDFPSSRFVVDGGALMNKPFQPALDAIYAQPAGRQVRRVLLYVAPDPGTPSADKADKKANLPGLAKSVFDSVVSMPRQESVGRELAEIREHNDLVANLRRLREDLFGRGVVTMASSLWRAYVIPQASSLTDMVVRGLEAGALEQGVRRGEWKRGELRRAVFAAWQAMLPAQFPGNREEPLAWLRHPAPVEGMSMTVMDVLKRGLALAPVTDREGRAAIRSARDKVHDQREVLAAVRDLDKGLWEDEAARMDGADVEGSVASAFESWSRARNAMAGARGIGPTVPAALSACAEEMARALLEARPVLLSIARAAARSERPADRAAAERVSDAVRELAPGPQSVRQCVRSLLAMEVALTAFSTAAPSWDQYVELMLISGDTPNAFDARSAVEGKLTGVNLAHFAAFYMASWRANDWMFGRLDGAWRLSQMLLSPTRLRQLFAGRPDEAFQLIERISLGTTPATTPGAPAVSPDVQRYLGDASTNEWDPVAARQELDFLDGDEEPPAVLTHSARGVARRLQLGILMEEIPKVAEAAESDRLAGASQDAARSLRAAYGPPSRDKELGARSAVSIFRSADVGAETIADEVGSDLFTKTVSTAVAVTVNAAGGAQLKLGPLNALLGSLKTVVMALYVLAQSAVRKSRTAFAVMFSLLTLGGLVVALPLISDDIHPPGVLTVLGSTFLVGGVLLAWLFARGRAIGLLLLVVTAAAVAAPLVLIDPVDGPGNQPAEGWDAVLLILRPILAVAALVAVPWCFSAMARSLRRSRAQPPSTPPPQRHTGHTGPT